MLHARFQLFLDRRDGIVCLLVFFEHDECDFNAADILNLNGRRKLDFCESFQSLRLGKCHNIAWSISEYSDQ